MKSEGEILGRLEAEQDAHQRLQLRVMRGVALGLLVAMIALFALAQSQKGGSPAWGFVGAFSEAAMVGAIADWFAVVALFRHPMGIPLWHTAIIPNSKADIARSLGEFVESHFVTVEGIVAKVRSYDPATKLADWLLQPKNGDRLGKMLAAVVRTVLASMDREHVREVLRQKIVSRLGRYQLTDPIAEFGSQLVAEQRHHELLDWVLSQGVDWLSADGAEERVGSALKGLTDNKVYQVALGAIAGTVKKLALEKIQAALTNEEHPLRQRYEAYIQEWLVRIKTDREIGARISKFQQDTLQSPRLQGYLDGLWDEIGTWIDDDLAHKEPHLGSHAARLALQLGEKLKQDQGLQDWINGVLMDGVKPLISDNRGKVATYIQSQIDAWSKEEMTERIELAVGRDLQFIRINGTLVGGLVGLLIYTVTWAFHGA